MPSSRRLALWGALLLLFAGVALGVDALFARMILASGATDAARVGRAVNRLDNGEIPIFGSSRALADYNPEILGPRFYNYGLSLTGLSVTNMLLAHELEKTSRLPVVIDVHPLSISDIGDASNYIPYAGDPRVEALMRDAGQWRWYYRVPGLRFFGSYDWYSRDLLGQYMQATKVTVRGYSRLLNRPPRNDAEFARLVARRTEETLVFGMAPREKDRLVALIRSAPQRTFFIVLSPLHRSNFARTTGEEGFARQLGELARLPNVRVLDYLRAPYEDGYWGDTTHLNEQGAAIFSAQLRDRIEAEVPGSTH